MVSVIPLAFSWLLQHCHSAPEIKFCWCRMTWSWTREGSTPAPMLSDCEGGNSQYEQKAAASSVYHHSSETNVS